MTYEGEYLTQAWGVTAAERQERTSGMARAGPDGLEGELHVFPRIERPEPVPRMRAGDVGFLVPFWPRTAVSMAPSGAMVTGATKRYRLIIERSDGTVLVIERPIEAIPVSPEEREWQRRRLVASARRFDPLKGWRLLYTKAAQKDAKKLAAAGLRPKAQALLDILAENPYQTPPPFEKLVGDLAGAYSRRINIQHRLVHEVLDDEDVVKVLRMWTHDE